MKCNIVVLGCALAFGLVGQSVVSAKPVALKRSSGPAGFPWRSMDAETYMFRDKGSGRMMRGVKLFILSPGYVPFVRDASPQVNGPRAQWRLTDAQGKSYIKNPAKVRVVGQQTRRSQKVHVVEFVCGYVPVPGAQAGTLKFQFPIDLRKITTSKKEKAAVVSGTGMVAIGKRRPLGPT